jgi:hypothetical protein
MMKSTKTPTIIAVTALVVSVLAATPLGHAAAQLVLAKNSVGTKQLKKNAVTGAKVKNGSLLAADFKAGQLPSGPQGPKGDPGSQGPKGDAGTARAYARVLIAFGQPVLVQQFSHNALAVRRVPGSPVGDFCVKVQGVPSVEPSPGWPQLASAPVANATAPGFASASSGVPCDGATEVQVQTYATNGLPVDAHFSVVVP